MKRYSLGTYIPTYLCVGMSYLARDLTNLAQQYGLEMVVITESYREKHYYKSNRVDNVKLANKSDAQCIIMID